MGPFFLRISLLQLAGLLMPLLPFAIVNPKLLIHERN